MLQLRKVHGLLPCGTRENINSMDKEFLIQLSRRTAIISGIFCIIVSLVLLFNYLQFSSRKPLETGAMDALIERLAEDPRNENL